MNHIFYFKLLWKFSPSKLQDFKCKTIWFWNVEYPIPISCLLMSESEIFFLQKPTSVQTMFNLKKCKLNSNICIELMTAVVVVMRWVKRINIGGLLSNHLSNNRKNNNGTFSFHSTFFHFDRDVVNNEENMKA